MRHLFYGSFVPGSVAHFWQLPLVIGPKRPLEHEDPAEDLQKMNSGILFYMPGFRAEAYYPHVHAVVETPP